MRRTSTRGGHVHGGLHLRVDCADRVWLVCGGDISGIPQLAFVPIVLCTVALMVFGVIATRLPPANPHHLAVRA